MSSMPQSALIGNELAQLLLNRFREQREWSSSKADCNRLCCHSSDEVMTG